MVLGAVLEEGAEDAEVIQDQLVGLGRLGTLVAGISVKAGLAAKKARKNYVSRLPCKPSGNARIGGEGGGLLRPHSYAKDPQKFLLVAEPLTSISKRNLPALPEWNPAGLDQRDFRVGVMYHLRR